MLERFKCFNVNFRLLKTIYVHLLVCYLNKLQNARCNDKDIPSRCYSFPFTRVKHVRIKQPFPFRLPKRNFMLISHVSHVLYLVAYRPCFGNLST